MKKTFTIILIMAAFLQSRAQIITPVHWSYAAKKISKDEAVVFIKAKIDQGWHLYSQTIKDGGPAKTIFTFPPSTLYSIVGKTTEPKPITKYEKVFNMNVSYFEHEVIFQQKIKLKTGNTIVKGTLEYMTCNDHECLPPDVVEFSVPIK